MKKDDALPAGFRVALDRSAREVAPGVWCGGTPTRVVRLTGAGQSVWRVLLAGEVDSVASGVLARRLTDGGLAHPCPPVATDPADVTVVVPVRDRAPLLDRCLAALGHRYPVIVVDDGSRNPQAVAAIAAEHSAQLVARPVNGGPGVARNSGLEQVTTELVAFVDSDCVPSPGWIDGLAGHFADPLVAAVAPRIMTLAGPSGAQRYARAASSLDMGAEPARVAPNSRVSYVPTAALLVRRAALLAVAGPAGVFDPGLRFGEDVDLVWRLDESGWRVRYDPSVRVHHREPATWPALLARRLSYGTSAAPLAVRHPRNLAPLVVDPWSAVTVGALLARRPVAAVAAFVVSVLTTSATLRRRGLPTVDVARVRAANVEKTFLAVGRYADRFAAPLMLALMARGGRGRWGRRAAVASLLLGPSLLTWASRRPQINPVSFVAASVADDIAYGAGVWAGCARHRTLTPVRPVRLRTLPGKKATP
jgi:mycofactocin system glycosyltransferase